jgi:hypothetical protein
MGGDDIKSITHEFDWFYHTDNLQVANPNLFPSSGTVSSSFTLCVVIERQASQWVGGGLPAS